MPRCKFQNGYTKKLNNSSWNKKDTIGSVGLILIFIITVLIICLFIPILGYYKRIIYICIGVIIIALASYWINNPIRIVYSGSCLISKFTKTPPFLDRKKHFPKSILFENKWVEIRKELDKVLLRTHNGKDINFTRDSFGGENKEIGSDGDNNRGWRILHVRLGSSFTKHGKRDFPTLCSILRKCPEIVACSVSILDEKTEIPMHVGYFKGVVRYMLPLKIPQDSEYCYLCVNGEKYIWKEGEGVLWDDTYPHRVKNSTTENRVVLYMDVKRNLNPFFAWLRDAVLQLMEGTEAVQNEIKKTEIRKKISENFPLDVV